MEALLDSRGIPSHMCVNCGSDTFKILAKFDDYDISWWSLNGVCYVCESPVTVPCPLDKPD